MSDYAAAWTLSRGRFLDTISDLSGAQLNWRLQPGALTIGEMALHVAGVEVSFGSQLTGASLNAVAQRLRAAATDGVVNERPFPFSVAEVTPEFVAERLGFARGVIGPVIENPSAAILEKEIVSALGPVITGAGALARLAFHSAYHQGQAYLIRAAPGFPTG